MIRAPILGRPTCLSWSGTSFHQRQWPDPISRSTRARFVNLGGSGSFDDTTASADLLFSWSFVSIPGGSTAVLTGPGTAPAQLRRRSPGGLPCAAHRDR